MSHRGEHRQVTRIVPARAGIVGNPSDGYGGRVVATTIGQLCAHVTATPAAASSDTAGEGQALLAAARAVAEDWLSDAAAVDVTPAALHFTTAIPRQVGLAGSSAIVIGAIEALTELHDALPDPTTVARLALRAEVDLLAIAAGPQDRVVQAHRGVLDMDFAVAWDATRYRPLPAAPISDLVVAWHPDPGAPSGVVHNDLRTRWAAGDVDVHDVMFSLAAMATRGAAILREGHSSGLAEIVDEACSLRRRLWTFSAVDEQLLAIAEQAGAAASLAGSGGAIVAVARSRNGSVTAADVERLGATFTSAGMRWLVPQPTPPVAAPEGSARPGGRS